MRLSPRWGCAAARDANTRAGLTISSIRILLKSIQNLPAMFNEGRLVDYLRLYRRSEPAE